MRNVALIGDFGSGKSTIAMALSEYGFLRYSFARPLRDFLALGYGEIEKNAVYMTRRRNGEVRHETGRELLQRFGTEVIRDELDTDFWVAAAHLYMQNRPGAQWVIDDMRFPNEYQMCQMLDFAIVRLTGRGIAVTKKELDHESERNHRAFKADLELDNSQRSPDDIAREIVHRMGQLTRR